MQTEGLKLIKFLLSHENKMYYLCLPLAAFTLNLNLLNASSVSKLHLTNSYNAQKNKRLQYVTQTMKLKAIIS